MLKGMKQWKLLNAYKKVRTDYLNINDTVVNMEIKTNYLSVTSSMINEGLTLIGQLVIFYISAKYIEIDKISVGQFVACAAYYASCAGYFNALSNKITNISGNLVGINRVDEFMQLEEEIDTQDACDHDIKTGYISFRDVEFGYDEKNVLRKINFQIQDGERVAIIGESGEGKSTIIQLLCRFYEPIGGNIYVDSVLLNKYTYESYRRQVAVVHQENNLFSGSLRKNIILSDEKKYDDKILKILEGLHLKELLNDMPDGLDTIVGLGGRELSGGQKQRIAVAKCIFREPKILLLDEATSALDEETEHAINLFIYEQLPNTTIVSIAHRTSAISSAERIIYLEKGKIHEKTYA